MVDEIIKAKKIKLKALVKDWLINKLQLSNDNIPEEAKVKLKQEKYIKFKLKVESEENSNQEELKNKSFKDKPVIYLLTKNKTKTGSHRSTVPILIDKLTRKFDNPTSHEKSIKTGLNFRQEKIDELERLQSTEHSINLGVGASAFGVDAKIGYEANWSESIRQKAIVQDEKSNSIEMSFDIPPGGAQFEAYCNYVPMIQDYMVELNLCGQVGIQFENKNQVSYEQGKFIQLTDKPIGVFKKNQVKVSIVDIFKDLKDLGKFPDSKNWSFVENSKLVSYEDKIGEFLCYSKDIEFKTTLFGSADQQVNNENNTSNLSGSTGGVLKKLGPASEPQVIHELPKHTVVIKRDHTGVSMPKALAQDPLYKEAIQEKIRNGMSSNPEIRFLFEQLANSPLKDDKEFKEFIKDLIKTCLSNPVVKEKNPDFSNYLIWLENNFNKLSNISTVTKLIEKSSDLYIRDINEIAQSESEQDQDNLTTGTPSLENKMS